MVFSSITFLFVFMPIVLCIYFILPFKLKNLWLLISSLVFLAFGSVHSMLIMLVTIFVNYISAYIMSFTAKKTNRKIILSINILINMSLLVYYKYSNFLVDGAHRFFGIDIPWREVVLPIGISFFVFQGLSYVIDYYRGEVKLQKNPLNLALYISLFPQLIAGPIVRYSTIEQEIKSRAINLDNVYYGLQRFIVGFSKKMILANTMGKIVDSVFVSLDYQSPYVLWMSLICYGLQIYFDFSGYSDMAIGLGRVFGFHFDENFNLPYISRSLTEFWRRWHISLSTWFRDYLYIPLGGSRKGNEYLNLAIVFLATGIWHGASSVFIIWGMWHGLFLMIEHYIRKKTKNKEIIKNKYVKNVLGFLYTNIVVLLGWFAFRADGRVQFMTYVKNLFYQSSDFYRFDVSYYINSYTSVIFIIAIVVALGIPQKIYNMLPHKYIKFCDTFLKPLALLIVFVVSIIYLENSSFNPFIYFRF